MHKKVAFKYTQDIIGYQEAVWDYLMEHCDITERGSLFIKFHSDSKEKFLKCILSRWRFNYHREDPRLKYQHAQIVKAHHIQEKTEVRVEKALKKEKQRTWRDRLRSNLIRLLNRYL